MPITIGTSKVLQEMKCDKLKAAIEYKRRNDDKMAHASVADRSQERGWMRSRKINPPHGNEGESEEESLDNFRMMEMIK